MALLVPPVLAQEALVPPLAHSTGSDIRAGRELLVPGMHLPRKSDQPRPVVTGTQAGATVTAARHLALFGQDGVMFYPRGAGGEPIATAAFHYQLETVHRGTATVSNGQPRTPQADGDAVVYVRTPHFKEIYFSLYAGIEQLFYFDALPQTAGDLVVTGTVTTPLVPVQREDGGFDFEEDGACRVVYSRAIAIDMEGRKVDVPITLVGNTLEIRVPDAWLQQATLPLVIDPLVGSNIQLTDLTDTETWPAVAYNAEDDEYLVVYVNDRRTLAASRLDADGVEIDGGVVLDDNTELLTNLVVSWSEEGVNRYLVAYQRGVSGPTTIMVLEPDLEIVGDPTEFEGEDHPDLAWDPNRDRWCVVCTDGFAAFVFPDGTFDEVDGGIGFHTNLDRPAIALSATSDRYLIAYGINANTVSAQILDGEDLSSIVSEFDVSNADSTRSEAAWNEEDDEWLVVVVQSNDISGRRIEPDGTMHSAVTIDSFNSQQRFPQVEYNTQRNSYFVSWQRHQKARDWAIMGREVEPDGTAVGSTVEQSDNDKVDDDWPPGLAYNSSRWTRSLPTTTSRSWSPWSPPA